MKLRAVDQAFEWDRIGLTRRRLLAHTAASVLILAAIVLLAFPGDPGVLWNAVEKTIQKPAVLAVAAAGAVTFLLWCVRSWIYRHHLLKPGPIYVAGIEDATVPPAGASVTVTASPAAPSNVVAMPAGSQAAPPGPASGSVAVLETRLRQALSELQLTAPTAMPGSRTSTDFVDLIGSTKLDLKQPFSLVGNLLKIVLPTHAYEVKATLLRRDAKPTDGIAVELTVLPRRITSLTTYWATSWEEATDQATSGVAARVVPLSSHSHTGPWSAWHGKYLPDSLFDSYRRFQRLAAERRYEEALEALYSALRQDPANQHLRFELGLMQEELALYLDALLTYYAVRDGLKERAQMAQTKTERRALERLELLVRYRSTVLLGFGERVADQWLPAPQDGKRSERNLELTRIRERLRQIFVDRYGDLKDVGLSDLHVLGLHADDLPAGLERLLGEQSHRIPRRDREAAMKERRAARRRLRGASAEEKAAAKLRHKKELDDERRRVQYEQDDDRRIRQRQLRLLFQLFACHDVDRLRTAYGREKVDRYQTTLTALAIDLLYAWSRLRTDRARHLVWSEVESQYQRDDPAERRAVARAVPKPWPVPDAAWVSWPLGPERVHELWAQTPDVRRAAGPEPARLRDIPQRLAGSRIFTDHYNAACTLAVGLLQEGEVQDPGLGKTRRNLAEAAVDELNLAVGVATSVQISRRWAWIVSEDPDLAGLRAEPEFLRFESQRFPSPTTAPTRPSDIVKLLASRHSARLFHDCADQLEREWHRRAALEGHVDIHEVLDWWRLERLAWKLADDLAVNYRHWQTRLEVVRQMQRFATYTRAPAFTLAHPRYVDDPIAQDARGVDRAARREIDYAEKRFGRLAHKLSHDGNNPLADIAEWETALRSLDLAGEELADEPRKLLASNRATAWGSLRDAFSPEKDGDDANLDDVDRALAVATSSLRRLSSSLPRSAVPRHSDPPAQASAAVRAARDGVSDNVTSPRVPALMTWTQADVDERGRPTGPLVTRQVVR